MEQQLKAFLTEDTDPFMQHVQYHSSWWLGDKRYKDISSHGIES